mgnify:FL=1
MTEEKIARINELAKKKKTQGLTDEENIEQAALRREYADEFLGNLRSQIEGIRIVDDNGKSFTAKEFNRLKKENKGDENA